MNRQRFYISTMGVDDQAYTEAMKYACSLADKDSSIERIVLYIHTKQQTGWFDRIFDKGIVKKLFDGYQFKDCRPIFKFETRLTYSDYGNPWEIIITCGMDSDDVLKIEDHLSIKAIIAIPWLKDGLKKWVSTFNPIELRGKKEEVDSYEDPSCIVKKAMEELTESINMATGITNPFDEKLAKTFILALHKYETKLDEEVVRAYLIRKLAWTTEDARDIWVLINTLNTGKYFYGGERTGLKSYYNRWEDECKNS